MIHIKLHSLEMEWSASQRNEKVACRNERVGVRWKERDRGGGEQGDK